MTIHCKNCLIGLFDSYYSIFIGNYSCKGNVGIIKDIFICAVMKTLILAILYIVIKHVLNIGTRANLNMNFVRI